MIKLVHLLHRRDGVTREDFQRWWRTSHAPLMRRQQPVRGKARYVQLHTLDPPAGSSWLQHSEYEGVSESWYSDLDEKRRLDALPAGVQARIAGRADHGPYIDPQTSSLQVETVEHIVFGPAGAAAARPRLVVVDCVAAAPGVGREEAATAWREQHAERVAALAELPGFVGYSQSLVDAAFAEQAVAGGAPEPFLGFAESAWESLEALAAAGSVLERDGAPAICAALERFRDPVRSLRFLTQEYVAIDGPRTAGA